MCGGAGSQWTERVRSVLGLAVERVCSGAGSQCCGAGALCSSGVVERARFGVVEAARCGILALWVRCTAGEVSSGYRM